MSLEDCLPLPQPDAHEETAERIDGETRGEKLPVNQLVCLSVCLSVRRLARQRTYKVARQTATHADTRGRVGNENAVAICKTMHNGTQ